MRNPNHTGCLDSLLRERWQTQLAKVAMGPVPIDEVNAHVERMPARYWKSVSESEAIWGLEVIHRFFDRFTPSEAGTAGVGMDWIRVPEESITKVILCAWDRRGLLASIVAAFSEMKIQIHRAGAFSRTDGLALDVFEVCQWESGGLASDSRLQLVPSRIEAALSNPTHFSSLWADRRHSILQHEAARMTPRIRIDNLSSNDHTVLNIEAANRIGLVRDILQALDDCSLNIVEAILETDDEIAVDVIHLTDQRGEKVQDPQQLSRVRHAVTAAIVGV